MCAETARVVLVVALRAEAAPLVAHFRMTDASVRGPFRLYRAADRPVSLVVSGVGRVAAGAAVAHVAAVAGCHAAWLNVGIAGHRDHPIGTTRLAHRVRDGADGRCWYPPLVFEPPCPTAAVQTRDTPCQDFPDDDLYDMEAAGYYAIAARHAPHELVHCLKVVSDNLAQPAAALTPTAVGELIDAARETVDRSVEAIAALAVEQERLRAQPAGWESVLGNGHFSVTRQRRLRRALRRWQTLCPDTDVVAWLERRGARDAGAVIDAIEEHLDAQPVSLGRQP